MPEGSGSRQALKPEDEVRVNGKDAFNLEWLKDRHAQGADVPVSINLYQLSGDCTMVDNCAVKCLWGTL